MIRYLVCLALATCLALTGPASAETSQDRLQPVLQCFHSDYGFRGATTSVALPDGRVLSVASRQSD